MRAGDVFHKKIFRSGRYWLVVLLIVSGLTTSVKFISNSADNPSITPIEAPSLAGPEDGFGNG